MYRKVAEINENILEAIKNGLDLVDIKQYGIAEPVMEIGDDVMSPNIVTPSGEGIGVFSEADMHDVLMYHRLQSISRTQFNGYGSRRPYKEVAEMSLIVYGKRKINQFDLERKIAEIIMQDEDCSVSTSNLDAYQVYANEYSGQPFFLDTRFFLFKINYSITCTRNDGCAK